jgi:hypothetical protein
MVKLASYEAGGVRLSEWTVRVVNQSDKPIKIPTSLSWTSNVTSSGPGRRSVLRLHINESVLCGGSDGAGSSPTLRRSVSLYGATDGSGDVTTLDPGQWITVVGRGPACLFPTSRTDSYKLTLDLANVLWYQQGEKTLEDAKPIYGGVTTKAVQWDGNTDWNMADSSSTSK